MCEIPLGHYSMKQSKSPVFLQLRFYRIGFRRKVLRPLLRFLRQGVSPGELALALLIGMILGLIPIPMVATVLCAALALVLRLNMGVIQLGNYLMYPLQLLLMLPLMEWGNALLGGPAFPWSFE